MLNPLPLNNTSNSNMSMEIDDEIWNRFIKKLEEKHLSKEKKDMLIKAIERGKKIKEEVP